MMHLRVLDAFRTLRKRKKWVVGNGWSGGDAIGESAGGGGKRRDGRGRVDDMVRCSVAASENEAVDELERKTSTRQTRMDRSRSKTEN